MKVIDILHNEVAEAIVDSRKDYLGAFPEPVTVDTVTVKESEFYIRDCKDDKSLICDADAEGRAAKYINATGGKVLFVKYDEFVAQFRIDHHHDWSKNIGRADYIVVTPETDRHFIVHELSVGSIRSKEGKARNQFIRTLQLLRSVAEMKAYIDAHAVKRCIVSAKDCDEVPPTPMGVAAGFARPYGLIPDPTEIKIPSLNKIGFTVWKRKTVEV